MPTAVTITNGAGTAATMTGAVTNLTGTLQIDTTAPTISSLTESPASGDLNAGKTVTLTMNLSEAVTVAGGTPTLTLNDGGTATYVSGSGTNALTFSYTVLAGQNTPDLMETAVNLNGATIQDSAGNAANLSLVGLPQGSPQIDTTAPTISSIAELPASGDLNAGNTVTLTLNLSEAVTVAGGTPTLTLNDGGIATYAGGSGTNALTFSYTVGAGQNTSALTATAVNLNSATVTDGAGNAANLSLSGLTQSGPQIGTTAPTISSLTESPASGDLNAGNTVTLTLNLTEAVTIVGGTPTLTLNDGGTATYASGSGTNALTFSYTVGAGQNTSALTATAVNLNSATIADGAGNAANLSLTGLTQSGPQIDTTTPTISSLTESPASGDLNAGNTITLTLNLSEAVTVAGGTPTLTLNDGGTATYANGSGTNALTFSYTVGAGQNTSALTATALSLNSATVTDGAGNAANLSLSGLTQSGPQIDTTTPSVMALAESPVSGDLNAGKVVTVTLDMSEVVTVNTTGGTPTLTLNDGGTATYVSGSGTNALTFSYTVLAGQNTPDLMETAVNLNGATIQDSAGNAANLSLVGLPQGSPQIDTTAPTISSIAELPASGDLNAGNTVTLTLNLSEAVTVAGGTPTLTLNDGGIATYAGGSGTNALTFSYTVGAGQNTSALTATAVNLNSATVTDGAGNAANLSLSGLTQSGPQIDTTTPPAPIIISDKIVGALAVLSGTEAENGTIVSIYDGMTLLGTTTTGTNGTWVFETGPLANGAHVLTATATDPAGNVSAPSSPYDPNVGAGPAITAAPIQVGSQIYIYNSAGADLTLSYAGTNVTAGEFGAWTPIAATQTASGYDIAWWNTATNQYTAWTTNSSGNFTGNLIGAVSGNSFALELLEPIFNQDLNRDGTIGLRSALIQSDGNSYGTTSLSLVANEYVLGNGASSVVLSYNGSPVTNGGGWTPIGAAQTATGYDVAWQLNGTNEFSVWAVDNNGNYVSNVIGGAAGNSLAVETIETTTFNQDLNGDGVIGLNPTVIQTDTNSFGSTSFSELGNNYFLFAAGATTGPELQYNGAAVTAGEFGGWTPIGAVQTASGYDIAWWNTATNQYTAWTTNSSGNFTGNLIGAVSGNSFALELLEPIFNQDLNGDGTIGLKSTLIQRDGNSYGTTSLSLLGNEYLLGNGTTGVPLSYNGSPVTSGGGWTPIGAVQTATGYDVAWQLKGTNEFSVWAVDNNGNYVSNVIGGAAGNSLAVETIETTFNQDLNGDGTIGLKSTLIQSDGNSYGTTSLSLLGNEYLLGNGTTSVLLSYNGSPVTSGGGWTPIGAVQTATGYDVAWQLKGTNEFSVWAVDNNGNYVSNVIGEAAGNSLAVESIEATFNQDLNGDGTIGLKSTLIQSDGNSYGTTSLSLLGNEYLVGNGTTGVPLSYNGSPVTSGGGWTPIGAVQTATGYDVAWQLKGTNEFSVWAVDNNGNYVSNVIGEAAGNSFAVELIEATFNQDLNGDGVVGLYATPGTTLQVGSALAGASGTATIGANATLELAAADSASVTFAASTGMLKLDQPSTFSADIFGFAGDGTLSGSDQIDLKGMNYNTVHDSYANGVLTVSDGKGDTAKLSFSGSYNLANFDFASDGSGGTIVYDPPVPPTSGTNTNAAGPSATSAMIGTGATLELAPTDSELVIFAGSNGTLILDGLASGAQPFNFKGAVAGFGGQDVIDLSGITFDAETTLGYAPTSGQTGGGTLSLSDGIHSANIALLGNYMASSFVTASDNHGGTMVLAQAALPGDQASLSSPHHP